MNQDIEYLDSLPDDIFSQQAETTEDLTDPQVICQILDATRLVTKKPEEKAIRPKENLYNRHIEILR